MRPHTSIGCLAVLTAAFSLGGCDPYGGLTSESRLPGVTNLPADDSIDDSSPTSRSDRFLALLAGQLQQPPTTTTISGASVYVGPLTFYRDLSQPAQTTGGVASVPPTIDTPDPSDEPPPIIPRGPDVGETVYDGHATGTVTEIAEGAARIAVRDADEDVTMLIDRENLRIKAVYIPGMVYSPDLMVPIEDPGMSYEIEGVSEVSPGWRWHVAALVQSHETQGSVITATVLVQTDGVFGNMIWSMEALHTTTVHLHGLGLLAAYYESDTPYVGIWDVPSSSDPIFPMDITQRFELEGDLLGRP